MGRGAKGKSVVVVKDVEGTEKDASRTATGGESKRTARKQVMLIKEAARIVDSVLEKRGSIRNLCFSSRFHDIRTLFGLVCETLRFSSVTDRLLAKYPMLARSPAFREASSASSTALLKVLFYVVIIAPFPVTLFPSSSSAPASSEEAGNTVQETEDDESKSPTTTLKGCSTTCFFHKKVVPFSDYQLDTSIDFLTDFNKTRMSQLITLRQMIRDRATEIPQSSSGDGCRCLESSPWVLLPPELQRNPKQLPRYARVNFLTLTAGFSSVIEALSIPHNTHRPFAFSESLFVPGVSPEDDLEDASDPVVTCEATEYDETILPTVPLSSSSSSSSSSSPSSSTLLPERDQPHRPYDLDSQLPGLLVFRASTDLHDHPLILEGKVILQDKASCVPPFVLLGPKRLFRSKASTETAFSHMTDQEKLAHFTNHLNWTKDCSKPEKVVIDCCAAPGSKTSQLADLMRNTGSLIAFERDPKRCTTLVDLTTRNGVKNISVRNENFLDVKWSTDRLLAKTKYILVDPSCSGTGIQSRVDDVLLSHLKTDGDKQVAARLRSLAGFQFKILSHALRFPKVKRVVYSTCSIHQEENEDVVRDILRDFPEFKLVPIMWDRWQYRGFKVFPKADYCVRASPDQTRTNGFFVACFQRRRKGARQVIATSTDPNPNPSIVLDEAQVLDQSASTAAPASEPPKKRRKV